jgi:hypothetical protein
MQDPYKASPTVGASLLCLGGVLILISGYFYLDEVPDKPSSVTTLLTMTGIGYGLWITGSTLLARSRFSSLPAGFLCGLLLVPGLLILLTVVPRRTRHEIWQAANPSLTGKTIRRQYPNQKSLY